jgi:hypothetical protein
MKQVVVSVPGLRIELSKQSTDFVLLLLVLLVIPRDTLLQC